MAGCFTETCDMPCHVHYLSVHRFCVIVRDGSEAVPRTPIKRSVMDMRPPPRAGRWAWNLGGLPGWTQLTEDRCCRTSSQDGLDQRTRKRGLQVMLELDLRTGNDNALSTASGGALAAEGRGLPADTGNGPGIVGHPGDAAAVPGPILASLPSRPCAVFPGKNQRFNSSRRGLPVAVG